MMAWSLGWSQLRSQWASGEVRVLLFALMLAVAATTAVGAFTHRIELALERQGGLLLGGDLVVASHRSLPASYQAQAEQRGMKTAHTLEFPSMVIKGEGSQLAQIKAVSEGFPLRGNLTISRQIDRQGHTTQEVPEPGTLWIEPRLARLLSAEVGSELELGERKFKVGAILQQEPSRGGDMFNYAPRVYMNAQDAASTGLIQFGSRIKYQLLVAGDAKQVVDFKTWAESHVTDGEKVEDIRTARPEMKSALDRAQKFLGLSAMVGVILAMVAMFLASLPYVQKGLDTYALMRCFGASRRLIVRVLLLQALLLALIGSSIGCLLGYAAQAGLAALAGSLFVESIPAPGWTPALVGMLSGFAILLAVVWPQFRRLSAVPALRILRRELGDMQGTDWLSLLPALLAIAGLIFLNAGNLKLGSVVLGGFIGLILVVSLIASMGSRLLSRIGQGSSAWKLGLANLKRRPGLSIAQTAGFGLGLMALMLLTLVRNDLLQNWQASLPPDAPNRFIINIQPAQTAGVQAFFDTAGLQRAAVYPMVKGRLVAVNDVPLDIDKYEDDRARRLAEREFNLSWAADMQQGNKLVAGKWWRPQDAAKPWISLEKGLAETLGLHLGDRLTYDIAGSRVTLTVTSLREVEWDSMQVNFFAVVPPGVLEQYSASYITSFHLPLGQEDVLNRLVREFPNLTVIDVAALMEQVRGIMNKMSYAVEYVFGFSLLAGLAVLYAALVATREERVREAALLRVLGASRRQVIAALLAEFSSIGLLAAMVAIVAANALAWYVSAHLLNIPYTFNFPLGFVVLVAAAMAIPLAAWLGIRGFLNMPPRKVLNSI
ncbi:MAG TPA: FtsX-like permease family protein [Methylophilaceae bacterium]|nr:FtsX-like permease family protein [Methylophilaceae bacterium]